MPFTIAAFVTRKPEVSPADFRTAYEESHLPVLKEAVGDAYPQTVTRHYVKRDTEGVKPLTFTGSEETFGYDLVSYLTFADEPSAFKFQQKYAAEQEKIIQNVASFAQAEKFRVIAFEDAVVSN